MNVCFCVMLLLWVTVNISPETLFGFLQVESTLGGSVHSSETDQPWLLLPDGGAYITLATCVRCGGFFLGTRAF